MQIKQEQREYLENIIKSSPVYNGNDNLLEDFLNETVKRAYDLVSEEQNLDSIKIYLKRIANSVILDVIKNSINQSVSSNGIGNLKTEEKKSSGIVYECDENGDISIDYDMSFDKTPEEKTILSEQQINRIKEVVSAIDSEEQALVYKNIFELRYFKGFNNLEIAEKLEISEYDVDKKLLFILNKINEEVFCA